MAHISHFKDRRAVILATADLRYEEFGKPERRHALIQEHAQLLASNRMGHYIYDSVGLQETRWQGRQQMAFVRNGRIITYASCRPM